MPDQTSTLWVLLVEGDERLADGSVSVLTGSGHSTICVPDLIEAVEALSIQRFDVVLLGSGQSLESCALFVERLRDFEARQGCDSRAVILGCGQSPGEAAFLDGSLPQDFDARLLNEVIALGQAAGEGGAIACESAAAAFPIFEPEQFEEQCANEPGLMIEIIDLFSAEQETELPAMRQALAQADFGQLSRLAHTIKGSLAALHAPLARYRAQAVEMAAKEQNSRLCAEALQALNNDLGQLNGLLSGFRQACLCS